VSNQPNIPSSSPALDVWVRLLRGQTALRRLLSASLEREHDLTLNDYETLLRLARAEGGLLRRVDLAGQLLLTQSGVTRLLDGLQRGGLVAKRSCESDGRVSYAAITESGRARLAAAGCEHLEQVERLLGGLFDSHELELLSGLLARLPGAGVAQGDECSAPTAAVVERAETGLNAAARFLPVRS
jgi:DNA-binding MarR family transcriptional regulator